MAFNILIVDDELDIRELVSGILEDNDYETISVGSYIDALEAVSKKRPNLVILDVWLGESDRDGIRLLEIIKKDYGHIPVIMMSGHSTIDIAVSAIKKGAYDFIEKPFDSNRLLTSVEKAIDMYALKRENEELKIKAKYNNETIENTHNSKHIVQQVAKIASMNGRCIIIAPSGSDKELIAKEIHSLSARAKNYFASINCNQYTYQQIEVELFGSQISLNQSMTVTPGILDKVNGGTLFIDELASASKEFQQKLLKLLQDGSYTRIGSNEQLKIDVRIIAGLPQNIDQLVRNGVFSNELYCRLNANTIKIPSLKTRREDIPQLLEYFMEVSAKAYSIKTRKFSKEAIGILSSYSWPGDMLQMKNMIDWILTVGVANNTNQDIIDVKDLPQEILNPDKPKNEHSPFVSAFSELSIKDARDAFEKEYLKEQLKKFSGNVSQAAKFIGMERSALHRKLKTLDIHDSKTFKAKDN